MRVMGYEWVMRGASVRSGAQYLSKKNLKVSPAELLTCMWVPYKIISILISSQLPDELTVYI
jgi:hypothetical protein